MLTIMLIKLQGFILINLPTEPVISVYLKAFRLATGLTDTAFFQLYFTKPSH